MTQQTIITTPANTGAGDSPKSAFDKVNANFTDLYTQVGAISISVVSYGADPTGVADSTAAIQAAINAVAALGGGTVFLPDGVYNISSTLTISSSGVTLLGAGWNSFHDTGSPTYPVKLNWVGGATPMVSYLTTSATLPMTSGCGFQNCYLECNGVATIGLFVQSVRGSNFANMYVKNAVTSAYTLTTLVKTSGEATDTQNNVFTNCTWRNYDLSAAHASAGMTLTSASVGAANANTSFNTFVLCLGETYSNAGGGVGFLLLDADNNTFIGCRVARNGTTTYGLSIRGADTNFFWGFSCGGVNGIEIRGTASGYFANPVSNTFFNLDDSNGTQYPTLDASCRAQVQFAIAGYRGTWTTQAVVADNSTSAEAEVANLGTSSLRIRNGSSNHVRLTDGTNEWSLSVNGGVLRISGISGTTANVQVNSPLLIGAGATAASVAGGLAIGGNQQTTVGANGAASALTANPLGYIAGYIGSTKIAIPYYNG